MEKHPTTEQMQAIVAEIRAYDATRDDAKEWQIEQIEHLFGASLPAETYLVTYTNEVPIILVRNSLTGKLERPGTWSYWASHNFEDRH